VQSDPLTDDTGFTHGTRPEFDGFELAAEESTETTTDDERTDTGTTGGNAPVFGVIAVIVGLVVAGLLARGGDYAPEAMASTSPTFTPRSVVHS
jgi:hypothetical protein